MIACVGSKMTSQIGKECMLESECNSKYSNLLSTDAYAQLVCYSRLDKVHLKKI